MNIEKMSSSLPTSTTAKANNKSKIVEFDESPPNNIGESFNVTQATKELKQALATSGSDPVIDTARVEAVRNQLDEGTYKIDAEKIAATLVELEFQFSNPG